MSSIINENLKKTVKWLVMQGKASSQRELALQMGYNPSAFSQILNGRVPVSEKFLGRLAAFEPMVNLEWLRTGQGNMLVTPHMAEAVPSGESDEMEFYSENTHGVKFYKKGRQIFMTVRHVPYAAFGQFANDSDRLEPLNDEWGEETYEVDRLARGNYLSFEVQGESMDTGSRQSFEAGDKVLVRELEREFWTERIRYNTWPYWVVVFGSSVLLKQIIAQDEEHGILTFHSLNPSPEYADFRLCVDDIRALYKVIKKKPKEIKISDDIDER